MSCRVLVGNLLKNAVVTMTPDAEADQGPEFLSDGPGKQAAIFGSLAANPTVLVDLGLPISFANGFEDGVVTGYVLASSSPDLLVEFPTPWTVEGDTPADGTYLTTIIDALLGFFAADHGGNGWSLAVPSNTSGGTAKLALSGLAGETYRIKGWVINGTGSSNGAAIRLRDTVRNLYLKTDGTWDASPHDLVTDATLDYVWLGITAGAGIAFTLPTADEVGADEVALELQLVNKDAGYAFFDDLRVERVSSTDLMMVTGGHNFPLSAVVKWDTSTDGASWTNRATFTVAKNQFFALLAAPVTAPFHRLQMTGTPLFQIFIGDLILGRAVALHKTPMEPVQIDFQWKGQARLESPGGARYIANRGPAPVRRVTLNFRYANATQEAEALGVWVDQARGGEVPVTVLPSTQKFPGLAIHGDIQADAGLSVSLHGARQDGTATGDLAGGADVQDHYSDLQVVIEEGPVFELDA